VVNEPQLWLKLAPLKADDGALLPEDAVHFAARTRTLNLAEAPLFTGGPVADGIGQVLDGHIPLYQFCGASFWAYILCVPLVHGGDVDDDDAVDHNHGTHNAEHHEEEGEDAEPFFASLRRQKQFRHFHLFKLDFSSEGLYLVLSQKITKRSEVGFFEQIVRCKAVWITNSKNADISSCITFSVGTGLILLYLIFLPTF